MTNTAQAARTRSAATITLASANTLIQEALTASEEIGIEVAVAVTDPGGHLIAFTRTDGARFLAGRIAIDKAWTAVSYGVTTDYWASYLTDPMVSQMGNIPGLLAAGGGYPIVQDGEVVGGIGISGGTAAQDGRVAETALTTLGFTI